MRRIYESRKQRFDSPISKIIRTADWLKSKSFRYPILAFRIIRDQMVKVPRTEDNIIISNKTNRLHMADMAIRTFIAPNFGQLFQFLRRLWHRKLLARRKKLRFGNEDQRDRVRRRVLRFGSGGQREDEENPV